MPFKPQFEGDFPSLGYTVIDWMRHYLLSPDSGFDVKPFIPYTEQEDFLINFYRLDPKTGKRVYRRAVLSRPRGWGKSPFAAAIAIAEGLAPVVFDGWDASGQPVGKPWSTIRTPHIQLAAVSEDQTKNTWNAVQDMIMGDDLSDDYPGLEVMNTFINLPVGSIRSITSSARSVKGARAVFSVLDQTEEWVPSNGGIDLATKMRSNAAKIGGTTLETPNAFIPGENSVAEISAQFAQQIKEGKTRDSSLLWDHREAPADTDLSDYDSLIKGLRIAYGDSSSHADGCVIHKPKCPPGHVDLDHLVSTIWDPATDPQVSRSDFLNQITHASDSWLSHQDVYAIVDRDKKVSPGDIIVMGFDGSRGRVKGKADATALVGMRVSDKHCFLIRVWEASANDGQDWQPDILEVDAVVRECFNRFNVVGFYADPSGWTGNVAQWEAKFGRQLRVKATHSAPISAWPRGKTSNVAHFVEEFRQAVVNRDISLDGSPALIRHLLNARRRTTRSGYLLYKSFPMSPDKIDAAYAAVMAYKACMDAVSVGADMAPVRRRKALIL